ncbi:hypothetical protein QCA50_014770 [Cerrena zonata]|uniref:Uncharacterized protein n=1 Tax=Cerrena zonata TaxID=2478898 RepID=A0AAW0FMD1_9APHY
MPHFQILTNLPDKVQNKSHNTPFSTPLSDTPSKTRSQVPSPYQMVRPANTTSRLPISNSPPASFSRPDYLSRATTPPSCLSALDRPSSYHPPSYPPLEVDHLEISAPPFDRLRLPISIFPAPSGFQLQIHNLNTSHTSPLPPPQCQIGHLILALSYSPSR